MKIWISTHVFRNKRVPRIQHPLWKWVFSDLRIGAAILNLNRIMNKKYAETMNTLHSPSFVINHELFHGWRVMNHITAFISRKTWTWDFCWVFGAALSLHERMWSLHVSRMRMVSSTSRRKCNNAQFSGDGGALYRSWLNLMAEEERSKRDWLLAVKAWVTSDEV